jgi:hypothetical protein
MEYNVTFLPYCDQSGSHAAEAVHGGPTQQLTYLAGLPEHQTFHQIQRHSLQQQISV